MAITIDASDFNRRVPQLLQAIQSQTRKAVQDVAEEVLRLSQKEVPHDTGPLQNSGHVEMQADDSAIVGYNKVYAARLHENPQYNFQKGRKGKYLEDPIKTNMKIFINFFKESMSGMF